MSARPGVVWINTVALERALTHARAAGADPEDVRGAERALAAHQARCHPHWRWTMLLRAGHRQIVAAIKSHARHRWYTIVTYMDLLGRVDDHGVAWVCPMDLAAELDVHPKAIHVVLADLEREPIGAIRPIYPRRQVIGIELTDRIIRRPKPRPRAVA